MNVSGLPSVLVFVAILKVSALCILWEHSCLFFHTAVAFQSAIVKLFLKKSWYSDQLECICGFLYNFFFCSKGGHLFVVVVVMVGGQESYLQVFHKKCIGLLVFSLIILRLKSLKMYIQKIGI